ncbi:hypothetical protein LTR36_001377 [Oleoguttula mirabilis]|uniref:Uncharacterized protein n=1 Tax=Oleoguttula mirabilis TaxID=1507867 RepID=A0AAV9JNL5_9PEZI|nr:hypothetical protein LTR36_001377 [Oleoguttula mirabilis]
MSIPSPASKQHSPSPRLAAGDDEAGVGKQRRKHGKDSGHASQTHVAAPVAEGKASRLPYCTDLSAERLIAKKAMPSDRTTSPVDENLFRSAVSHAEDEEHDSTYPDAPPEELLPPPDFQPFFTLVENPDTGEHHHPSVHYLFSDDDEEIMSDATLMAIDQAAASGEQAEVEERIVVIDMAADGKSVVSATSLSSHWQALRTVIGQAPSWGDSSDAADKGRMLKLSGQGALDVASQKDNRTKVDRMEELAIRFGERLASLDEVLGKEAEEGTAQGASLHRISSNV